MFFSTEKCLSDPSEKLTTVTGITLSDDAADLPPKFTIRDYVFNSRAEDLESYWPFSKRSLQICLKHGVRDVLPPYQSLRSLRNQMVMEDVRKLSKLRINGGLESEEFTSSKVCPVCKSFSSPSNTTLNAHIDQCLAAAAEPAAESASKKPGAKHGGGGRTERRKVRSMADVYAAARRCTLEDLDRRNGTKWSGGDRAPSDGGGFEPRRTPRRTRGRVSEDGSGGAVYFDSDGTKLRILSKLDDGVVGGDDDDDDGKRSRSSRGKTASRRHKTSEEEEEFPETDGDGERENGSSGYRSEKRVRRKKTTDENRECSSSSSHEEYVVEPPSRPKKKKKKKPRPESEKRATSVRTSARLNRGPPDDDGGDDEEDEDAFFSRKRTDRDGAADSDRFVDYPVEEPHPGLLFSGLSSQDSSLFFNEFPTAVVEEIAIPGPPGSFLPSPGRGGNSFVSCCEDGDGFGNGCDSSLLAYDPDDEGGITNRAPSGCGQVGGGGGVLRLMGKDLMVAPSSQVTMQTGGSLRLQRHRPSLVTAAVMMRDACGMHGGME